MLTLIAGALVETLVKHMFQKKLNEMDKVEIGGAPSWYMKEVDDKMCTFSHSVGGLDSIEIGKNKAKIKMIKDIDGLLKIVIYENTKKITNKKEQKMIDVWGKDSNLKIFTSSNINYSRIVYEDEINTAFVRACIPKETIISYQKQRLQDIKKSLLKYKMGNALDELETSIKDNK